MRQLIGPIPAASRARSAAFARDWAEAPGRRALAAAFVGLPDAAGAVADAATVLFGDTGWLDDLLARLIAGLAADPWFDPPVRTSRDALRSGAILYEDARVAVTLSVLSAERLRARPPAATMVFGGRTVVTRYLAAGGATLRRWAAPPLPDPCVAGAMGRCRALPDFRLADGAIVRLDGRVAAHVLTAPVADVVTLTATVRAGADPVAREYDTATGAFVALATTDDGAARAQLLLGLLRASGGGGDAGATRFDAATRDGAFFLRWSALREWLACDARRAWPRLREMAADDPHPEVHATAAATLDRLARAA